MTPNPQISRFMSPLLLFFSIGRFILKQLFHLLYRDIVIPELQNPILPFPDFLVVIRCEVDPLPMLFAQFPLSDVAGIVAPNHLALSTF